jgi:hypothetical protein
MTLHHNRVLNRLIGGVVGAHALVWIWILLLSVVTIHAQTLPTLVALGSCSGATPGIPAGSAADDIMLLGVEMSGNDGAPHEPACPTDWAHVTGSPQDSGALSAMAVCWKRHDGSESAPSITAMGTDHEIGVIIGIRGAITTEDPWSGTPGLVASDTTTTSHNWLGATTDVANTFVVIFSALNVGDIGWSSQTNANLANITEQTDTCQTSSGNDGEVSITTGEYAGPGSFGTTTATASSGIVQLSLSVAIKAAATAATKSPFIHLFGGQE